MRVSTAAYSEFRRNFSADCRRAWPGASNGRVLWNVCVDSGLRSTLYLRVQLMFQDLGLGPLARVMSRLNMTSHALDVVVGARIGPGLVMRHPSGIVIGHKTVVGSNATIMQGVTLGQRDLTAKGPDAGNPVIDDGATLGCGAVILGSVRIGANAVVGACSLVLSDVPPGATAVGVPAKVLWPSPSSKSS